MKLTIDNNYIKVSTDDMNEKELTIDSVFVRPGDRGKGIGRQLVDMAIEYAQNNGYESVGLYAEPQTDDGLDGDALIEFYRSCGFESDSDCNELMTYEL